MEYKAGDLVTHKLLKKDGIVIKWLDPKKYNEVDETLGNKYLLEFTDGSMKQAYACALTPSGGTL